MSSTPAQEVLEDNVTKRYFDVNSSLYKSHVAFWASNSQLDKTKWQVGPPDNPNELDWQQKKQKWIEREKAEYIQNLHFFAMILHQLSNIRHKKIISIHVLEHSNERFYYEKSQHICAWELYAQQMGYPVHVCFIPQTTPSGMRFPPKWAAEPTEEAQEVFGCFRTAIQKLLRNQQWVILQVHHPSRNGFDHSILHYWVQHMWHPKLVLLNILPNLAGVACTFNKSSGVGVKFWEANYVVARNVQTQDIATHTEEGSQDYEEAFNQVFTFPEWMDIFQGELQDRWNGSSLKQTWYRQIIAMETLWRQELAFYGNDQDPGAEILIQGTFSLSRRLLADGPDPTKLRKDECPVLLEEFFEESLSQVDQQMANEFVRRSECRCTLRAFLPFTQFLRMLESYSHENYDILSIQIVGSYHATPTSRHGLWPLAVQHARGVEKRRVLALYIFPSAYATDTSLKKSKRIIYGHVPTKRSLTYSDTLTARVLQKWIQLLQPWIAHKKPVFVTQLTPSNDDILLCYLKHCVPDPYLIVCYKEPKHTFYHLRVFGPLSLYQRLQDRDESMDDFFFHDIAYHNYDLNGNVINALVYKNVNKKQPRRHQAKMEWERIAHFLEAPNKTEWSAVDWKPNKDVPRSDYPITDALAVLMTEDLQLVPRDGVLFKLFGVPKDRYDFDTLGMVTAQVGKVHHENSGSLPNVPSLDIILQGGTVQMKPSECLGHAIEVSMLDNGKRYYELFEAFTKMESPQTNVIVLEWGCSVVNDLECSPSDRNILWKHSTDFLLHTLVIEHSENPEESWLSVCDEMYKDRIHISCDMENFGILIPGYVGPLATAFFRRLAAQIFNWVSRGIYVVVNIHAVARGSIHLFALLKSYVLSERFLVLVQHSNNKTIVYRKPFSTAQFTRDLLPDGESETANDTLDFAVETMPGTNTAIDMMDVEMLTLSTLDTPVLTDEQKKKATEECRLLFPDAWDAQGKWRSATHLTLPPPIQMEATILPLLSVSDKADKTNDMDDGMASETDDDETPIGNARSLTRTDMARLTTGVPNPVPDGLDNEVILAPVHIPSADAYARVTPEQVVHLCACAGL